MPALEYSCFLISIFVFNRKKHQQQESAIKMVFIGGYINRKNVDEQGGVVRRIEFKCKLCFYVGVCLFVVNKDSLHEIQCLKLWFDN